MTNALPFLALLLGALALFLPGSSPVADGRSDLERRRIAGTRIAIALLLAVGLVAARLWPGAPPEMIHAVTGAALGVLIAVLAHALEARRSLGGAAAPALAVALAAGLHWLATPQVLPAQLGLVFAASASAWALGAVDRQSRGDALTAAVVASLVVAGDALGRQAVDYETASRAGSALALVVLAAMLATDLVRGASGGRASTLAYAAAGTAVLLAAAWMVALRFLSLGDAFTLFAGGVGAGLVVHFLLAEEEKPDSVRFLLAVVIWIGIATWAFGIRRGFGMSVSLMGAASVLLLMRNPRALLSLGPLVALVFYRLFREAHTDASRALDIGQHYALLGIALGLVLPLLPTEWARERVSAAGTALWTLLLVALPVSAAIVLGPKGLVGLLAGLGFASVFEGLKGTHSLAPLALAGGLASLTTLTYGWMSGLLDLTRNEKMAAFYWMGPGIALAALLIAWLSRDAGEKGDATPQGEPA
jgi:hypothetical protein